MTISEIMQQAQKLSAEERKELVKFLVDTLVETKNNVKTGAEIAAMLEKMPPIEFVDEDISDPVDWVKAQRSKESNRLNWNAE